MYNGPSTPSASALFDLHSLLCVALLPLLCLVALLILDLLVFGWAAPRFFPVHRYPGDRWNDLLLRQSLRSQELLELAWSGLPSLLLLYLGSASLHVLYLADELVNPDLTVRAVGHQWYWSYEYEHYVPSKGHLALSADSYPVLGENLLGTGKERLWAADFSAPLPVRSHIRLLTTSSDVIHSWTLPSAFVKVDSIPGRLNQTVLFFQRPGRFFGQCSELCGANHGFMPISVTVVEPSDYNSWVNSKFYPRKSR